MSEKDNKASITEGQFRHLVGDNFVDMCIKQSFLMLSEQPKEMNEIRQALAEGNGVNLVFPISVGIELTFEDQKIEAKSDIFDLLATRETSWAFIEQYIDPETIKKGKKK